MNVNKKTNKQKTFTKSTNELTTKPTKKNYQHTNQQTFQQINQQTTQLTNQRRKSETLDVQRGQDSCPEPWGGSSPNNKRKETNKPKDKPTKTKSKKCETLGEQQTGHRHSWALGEAGVSSHGHTTSHLGPTISSSSNKKTKH